MRRTHGRSGSLLPFSAVGLRTKGRFVRFWDQAATEGGGCYTAGVLMCKGEDGLFYIVDVVRGQWSPNKRANRQGRQGKAWPGRASV